VKPDQLLYNPRIVEVGFVGPLPCDDPSARYWQLYVCNGSCPTGKVGFSVNGSGECPELFSDGTVNVGVWSHVAATCDGATEKIYINGSLEGERNVSCRNIPVAPGAMVVGNILTYAIGGGGDFDGQIDELRIWNVARSQAEINDNMNTEIDPSTQGLVGYWRLNGDGSDLVAGNTLTPYGAITFVSGKLGQAVDIQGFTYSQYRLEAPALSSYSVFCPCTGLDCPALSPFGIVALLLAAGAVAVILMRKKLAVKNG
jgi:cytoskeletal protein CcmA (bactofilin family)